MKEMDLILQEVLQKVNPSKEEINEIESYLKQFLLLFKTNLKKEKIDAQLFVGGSFAKKTLIKKGVYDIDVFIRFSEEYRGKNISDITEKALKKIVKKGLLRVHGSRDYFRVEASDSFFLEVIPVIKVTNPKKAENITDLSYFHVDYINKKLKTQKMIEEVRLAKAFCHATNCYGAESYINGFSGYALELLVYHYGGFLKMINRFIKLKDREFIDLEKQYKNKNEITMNMNSAKTNSPIILIDPTYKERNALAALSQETFDKFKLACSKFLEHPSIKGFEKEEINIEKIKEHAKNKNLELVLIQIGTDKQKGDIAGSKLLKFYKYITKEIEKYFIISKKGFKYNDEKEADIFFVVKNKGEIIFSGPNKEDKKNVEAFKKKHKDIFIKKDKLYAKEKLNEKVAEFLKEWKSINSQKIIEMHIIDFNIKN